MTIKLWVRSKIPVFWLSILRGQSILRAYQNRFLSNQIEASPTIYDFGAKSSDSPYGHILMENCEKYIPIDSNRDSSMIYMNLDEPFRLEPKIDAAIAFNVIEHLFEYQSFVESLKNSINKNGVIYVATPFMHPYHPDPADYCRFTTDFYIRLFESNGFQIVKTELVGKGRVNVMLAMLIYRSFLTRIPLT